MILPREYALLEYIESTGTQHIDTGVIVQSEKLRIVMDFIHTKQESNVCFFGVQYGGSAPTLAYTITVWLTGTSVNYDTGGSSAALVDGNYAIGERYLLDITADNGKITRTLNDNTRSGTYSGNLDHTLSIPIFGLNFQGSVGYKSCFKLFSMKIYDNDILVRDYVPCINLSGQAGLYDTVGNTFYGNAGTGEFIAGPVVTTVFDLLITDRTASDVDRVREISTKIMSGTATSDELAEFNSAMMKGAYNYTDLNRVNAAMEVLKVWLEDSGYAVPEYRRSEIAHVPRLPAGYKELEYVGGTGTQFIKTGVLVSPTDTIEWETSIRWTDTVGRKFMGMSHTSDKYWGVSDGNYELSASRSSVPVSTTVFDKVVYVYEPETRTNRLYVNGVLAFSKTTVADTVNKEIGLWRVAETAGFVCQAQIAYSKIKVNGTLVCNMIPCINSDGAVGMYDPANGQFHSNAGTGTFVGGDVVVLDPHLWYESDTPTVSDMALYLANVEALRSVVNILSTTPETPVDMDLLTFEEANDIEKILEDIYFLLTNAAKAWVYSGEVFSGEV